MLSMRTVGKKTQGHGGPHPERGFVQFLLLLLLNEEPMHGYQLAEELQSRGYVKQGRFKTGSLYTILNRMEKKGILNSTNMESETGRHRRVYNLTEDGKYAFIINQETTMSCFNAAHNIGNMIRDVIGTSKTPSPRSTTSPIVARPSVSGVGATVTESMADVMGSPFRSSSLMRMLVEDCPSAGRIGGSNATVD